MRRVVAIVCAVASCAALAALPAAAAQKTPRDLWATINICDTAAHPDSMGIRASMPGDANHTRMYMRFNAQYYVEQKQQWLTDLTTRWYFVGSGQFARRQGGYTFAFSVKPGEKHLLRGAVDFKWTKRGHVVRTAHVLTRGGHPGTIAADPKSYSSALCTISD